MYNKLVIILAALLSAKIGFSQSVHPLVKESLSMLEAQSINLSIPETAYHLGVVHGYFNSSANPSKLTQDEVKKLDTELDHPLLNASRYVELTELPDIKEAISKLNTDFNTLSDRDFCLYKAVTIGEFLAGRTDSKVIFASMTGHDRGLSVCTPLSAKMLNSDKKISDASREQGKVEATILKIKNPNKINTQQQ